jgi:hypothetical protein
MLCEVFISQKCHSLPILPSNVSSRVKLSLLQAVEALKFETSRLPHFINNELTGGAVVVCRTSSWPAALCPQEDSSYEFSIYTLPSACCTYKPYFLTRILALRSWDHCFYLGTYNHPSLWFVFCFNIFTSFQSSRCNFKKCDLTQLTSLNYPLRIQPPLNT